MTFKDAVHVGLIAVGAVGATVSSAEIGSEQHAKSVWDGIYTEEQAKRGSTFYQESCAVCHAPDLAGGEMSPELVGATFRWNWNGLTMGQLFERVRISMPQDNPNSVSRQEKADILAYVLLVNQFPVGDTELASRTEVLNQFMFEAVKRDIAPD